MPLIGDGEPAQILSSCAVYNDNILYIMEEAFNEFLNNMQTNRSLQGRGSNVPESESTENNSGQLILSSSAYLDFVPISATSIRALVLV